MKKILVNTLLVNGADLGAKFGVSKTPEVKVDYPNIKLRRRGSGAGGALQTYEVETNARTAAAIANDPKYEVLSP